MANTHLSDVRPRTSPSTGMTDAVRGNAPAVTGPGMPSFALPAPRRVAAIAAGALVMALTWGCGGDDPTQSAEYRDLLAERNEAITRRDELAADVAELEDDVVALEADVQDAREQLDSMRDARDSAEAERRVAEAERDAALAALDAVDGRDARRGTDSMNDRVLTSGEAEDVLDGVRFARFVLDDQTLEGIGSSLCTVAESSVDAVEFTESVLGSFSGDLASVLGGEEGVGRFVGRLGSKMCNDELVRLGFTPE